MKLITLIMLELITALSGLFLFIYIIQRGYKITYGNQPKFM